MFWLIPGKLAGREGPSVRPWNFEELKEEGVTVILSTEEDCHGSLICKAGLRHIPKFMPQTYPTTPALVDRFVDLVRDAAVAVLKELEAGEVVLVHCYAGRDRTGLVLAAVLMELEDLDFRQAYIRVKSVRPEAMVGPGVIDVLEEYAIRLKAKAF